MVLDWDGSVSRSRRNSGIRAACGLGMLARGSLLHKCNNDLPAFRLSAAQERALFHPGYHSGISGLTLGAARRDKAGMKTCVAIIGICIIG